MHRALALLLALVAGDARAARRALDACDVGPNDNPAQAVLAQAEHDLAAGDRDKVRAALAQAEKDAGGVPWILLWAGNLDGRLGDKAGAERLYQRAITAAHDAAARGDGDAQVARLYEAAALVRMGKTDEGKRALASVRGRPGALKTYACRYIPVAQALADAGDSDTATALLDEVAKAAPRARSIQDASVDLAYRAGSAARIEKALDAALARFPDGLEFVVRKANFLKTHQRPDEARALLEKQLLRGVADPSLLGEFLGLVSGDAKAKTQLERYTKLAEAHPDLPALAMIVGVEHHYLHDYAASTKWMEKAGKLVDREPRVAMYLAMNHFHMGHQKLAEDFVDRAARAGRPDPDIYYCRAVIEVRADPGAALRDLERYMALTKGRADVEPLKQERVQQTMDLLAGCMKSKDPRACVETEVVQKAKALAFREHFPGDGSAAPMNEPRSDPKPAPPAHP